MPDLVVFIGCFIGFVFGFVLFQPGVKQFLFIQKIKELPMSKVGGTAVGLVKLSGAALCRDPMRSPITGVKCAYWRFEAQYFVRKGGWRNFYTLDSHKPFYLVDGTGKMLVDPAGADIDIPPGASFEGDISAPKLSGGVYPTTMDSRVVEFITTLDEAGKKKLQDAAYEGMRVIESYIVDGDQLFALGSIEPAEGLSNTVGYENLILRKGDVNKTMYISTGEERNVIEKMSRGMYPEIFVGLIILVICLLLTIINILPYLGM